MNDTDSRSNVSRPAGRTSFFRLHGSVQQCPAGFVLAVHIGVLVDERGHLLQTVASAADDEHHRRRSRLVFDVRLGNVVEQRVQNVRVLGPGSEMQRRASHRVHRPAQIVFHVFVRHLRQDDAQIVDAVVVDCLDDFAALGNVANGALDEAMVHVRDELTGSFEQHWRLPSFALSHAVDDTKVEGEKRAAGRCLRARRPVLLQCFANIDVVEKVREKRRESASATRLVSSYRT